MGCCVPIDRGGQNIITSNPKIDYSSNTIKIEVSKKPSDSLTPDQNENSNKIQNNENIKNQPITTNINNINININKITKGGDIISSGTFRENNIEQTK